MSETHTVPELGYSYDALEPHIDAQTMEIHHTKHHAGYVAKLNAALEKHPELKEKSVFDLLADLDSLPEEIRTAVQNNGGGHWNHTFFWKILKKDVELKGEIFDAIKEKWGSFEEFKNAFTEQAITQFGSGWAWLGFDKNGKLHVESTENQDSPISKGHTPLLCLDVWEHAYYLKYQNKRPDYVEAFFNVINWEKVNELYLEGKKE